MKLLVVLGALALLGLAGAAPTEESGVPIELDYHGKIGIPLAARIKAAEEALIVDGSRIAGGSPANLGDYPYFGGIVITLNDNNLSACGSSLISNTRAVTAAHCQRTPVSHALQFEMVFGSTLLFSGGERRPTTDIETHQNYNMSTLHFDVAIVRFESVTYTHNIRAISLYSGSEQFVGSVVWTAGYGRQGDTSSITTSQYLSHVSMQVITNADCAAIYPATVTNGTLCTSTSTGAATCAGDSGGPLVLNNELVGITSFAHISGCQQGYPAGFNRVSSYVEWFWARM